MVQKTLKAYVLFGGVEPWVDSVGADASRNIGKAEFVVAITPFANDQLREIAHVLLPMGTYVETSGTYVNLEGNWQSHTGAAQPFAEARPGWKILRVLGTLANISGFEYQSSEDVREELRKSCTDSRCDRSGERWQLGDCLQGHSSRDRRQRGRGCARSVHVPH